MQNKYLKHLKFRLVKSKYKNPLKGKVEKAEDICNTFFDLKDWAKETMIGIYLDEELTINLHATLGIGTRTANIVAIDEVLDNAIITRSRILILIHNHTNGDPTPSKEDLEFIKALQNSCKATNRILLDFIITGYHNEPNKKHKYFSLFEETEKTEKYKINID